MGKKQPLILLIDDEQDIREILAMKLKAVGFRIEEAATGEEGINKAKKIKPDLVLLDFKMPGMNGGETLFKIKADPGLKDLKVVFLTNYGEPMKEFAGIDKKFAKEIGALDYIRKTEDLDTIVEEIKNIFNASAAPNTGN